MEVVSDYFTIENVGYYVTSLVPYSSTILSGTVLARHDFNANADVDYLSAAIKKKDCKFIIRLLCSRSNNQRQEIRRVYELNNQKDLISDISKKLSGDFHNLVVALLQTPAEFDANEMHNAMKGKGTDSHVLIEILTTQTNSEIQAMKQAYFQTFTKELMDEINSETSGQLKDVFTSLLKASKNENIYVNFNEALNVAKYLQSADQKTWEKFFNETATVESCTQLQSIFLEYSKLTGNDVETMMKKIFKGSVEECHVTQVKTAKNTALYFAELLYKAMKGLGTSDKQLIRIIVSRCEKDMIQIKEEFERAYKQPLELWIKDDTYGDYRDGLIMLVTGNVNLSE